MKHMYMKLLSYTDWKKGHQLWLTREVTKTFSELYFLIEKNTEQVPLHPPPPNNIYAEPLPRLAFTISISP